jgi:hypothetical protein
VGGRVGVIALVGVGLLAVAALVVAAARAFRADAAAFAATAARAPGVVVDVPVGPPDASAPSGSTSLFFPVVRFTAADGRTHESPTREGSRPAAAAVGERVTVLYDPADPGHVDLEGRQPQGVTTVLLVLAALVAVAGVVLVVAGVA